MTPNLNGNQRSMIVPIKIQLRWFLVDIRKRKTPENNH